MGVGVVGVIIMGGDVVIGVVIGGVGNFVYC